MLLDHDGYLPSYAKLTDSKTHEVNIAHELKLPAGSIVAIDRGYLDFKLLEKWDNAGIGDEVKLIRNDDFGGLLLETERLSGDVWIAW